jgi:hypothetical protein
MPTSSTHVICIGGSNVLTGTVREHTLEEKIDRECSLNMTSIPLPSEYNVQSPERPNVEAIFNVCTSIHPPKTTDNKNNSHERNLHLVVSAPLHARLTDLLLHEASALSCNNSVLSAHSSAAALCVAAFSSRLDHAAPNILLTDEGARGYCEWEKGSCGNRQRLDLLAGCEGVMRVVVAEVGRGE